MSILPDPDLAEHRKSLGQVFSGPRVARLLAALAGAPDAGTVLDPMCGSGDLLAGCAEFGVVPARLAGIEVDPAPLALARARLGPEPLLIRGDAFQPDTLSRLPARSFGLVIGNPPYVRYQRLGAGDVAGQVRAGLLECVQLMPHLDPEDRRLFAALVRSYSGLADLAIPAWLLSAMLVRPGGRLALVVPAAWLTRDYARPVWYALLRWFRLRFVVEDAGGHWFRGRALVRTNLVVAERIERRPAPGQWGRETYLRIRLHPGASDEASLVGRAGGGTADPDVGFVARMRRLLDAGGAEEADGLWEAHPAPLEGEASRLGHWSPDPPAAGAPPPAAAAASLPRQLQPLLPRAADAAGLVTLGELGWQTGQGLRTGANRFFYVTRVGTAAPGVSLVQPDAVFRLPPFPVPDRFLVPVLRRQAELPQGFRLDPAALSGRALVLHGYVLPEDLAREQGTQADAFAPDAPAPLPQGLAALVRAASTTNLGTEEAPRFVPELSAVRTNASGSGIGARRWFHLPPFTARHRPALLMARINTGPVLVYENSAEPVLVDANFSTLWPTGPEAPGAAAVAALLRSAWCRAALEASATILGAGALKVEATHLRALVFPSLSREAWARLEALGSIEAPHSEQISHEADRIVLAAWVGEDSAAAAAERLRAWVRGRVAERSRGPAEAAGRTGIE